MIRIRRDPVIGEKTTPREWVEKYIGNSQTSIGLPNTEEDPLKRFCSGFGTSLFFSFQPKIVK